MNSFAKTVTETVVPEGRLGVFFAGQAGFVFKTPSGTLVGLDLYLSDCCNRFFGFKRLMPYLFGAEELTFDAVFASHAHYDHFDIDSMAALTANGKTQLVAACDCRAEYEKLGLSCPVTYLKAGDEVTIGDFHATAVACDHGKDTPDALGFLITAAGKRVYTMGDTCFRPDFAEDARLCGADLLIHPINGAFGNLNAKEGVEMCRLLAPALAVPCHYWNFAEHYGDPAAYIEAMRAAGLPFTMMRPGEGLLL